MGDLKVKGTMFVDQVRMIRANKGLDWSKHLTPADWEIINTRILLSEWYPLEIYIKCALAVFEVIAQGNIDIVRLRGRMRGKELFETVYKTCIIPKDPADSLSRFVTIYVQFFNSRNLTFEKKGKTHARLIHDSKPTIHANRPYCYQLMGYLDTLIELAGGINIKIELTAKQWEGASTTVFEISWE